MSPIESLPCGYSHPLTGKSSSYVKNSAHFMEKISHASICQMVSLDVVSLFMRVPTNNGMG